MIAFLLGLAFAANTVCVDQSLSKYNVCVTMDNAIRLNGKECRSKGMEGAKLKKIKMKLAFPYNGVTHEEFFQCTWCAECD